MMASAVWREVNSKDPCPICAKIGWCSLSIDGRYAVCRRVGTAEGSHKVDSAGGDYWVYRLEGAGISGDDPLDLPPSDEAERADPDFLDQVHKDLKQRLREVRREDKEAVDYQWRLENARLERFLLPWWTIATAGPGTPSEDDEDDRRRYTFDERAKAAEIVLKILSRIEVIGGLIPQKPLIQINQDNRRLIIGTGDGPTTQEQIQDAFNLVRLAFTGDPGIGGGFLSGDGYEELLDSPYPDTEAD